MLYPHADWKAWWELLNATMRNASVVDSWCKVCTVLRFAQATRASASLGRLHPMVSSYVCLSVDITAVAVKLITSWPEVKLYDPEHRCWAEVLVLGMCVCWE
jgi:hypothetical protein